jgi:hypothetical protein
MTRKQRHLEKELLTYRYSSLFVLGFLLGFYISKLI